MDNQKKVNELLDYSKYGFDLKSQDRGLSTYVTHVGCNCVELKVLGNSHTLRIIFGDKEIMCANRYEIIKQEQLDFIILNGRAGILFSPLHSIDKVS